MAGPSYRLAGVASAIEKGAAAAIRRRTEGLSGLEVSVVPGAIKRTVEKNLVIGKVQMRAKRNPFFLTKEEVAQVKAIVAEDLGRTLTPEQLGVFLVTLVRAHLDAQKNKNGSPFRPLSARYAAWKRKRFGALPILVLTRELRDGLRSLVVRKGTYGGGRTS